MLRLQFFALMLLATTALSPLVARADDHPLKGVALVIGESDYAGLQKLDNPKRDARAMDDMLDSLGFTVDRVLDGDAKKLRQEIADFVAEAKDADVALVYYSGHGIEADGTDFLVPIDTDLSTPATAGQSLVPVSDLLDQLAKTVPVTIVLLDACRTNSFPAGQLVQLPGAAAAVPVAAAGLEALRGPTPVAKPNISADNLGMVVGFAASPGEPALDGDPDGNSPYAAALLKHFAAGGYSFGDLMTLVSQEVYLKTKARQLPWVNSSLRRVLSFGKPVEAISGDDAAIRDGRRQLLLTIAQEPDATRKYVENVADAEGVPLDALYGMLKVLGVDTTKGQDDLQTQLRQGADKLKAFLAEKPGGAKTDPELVRLAGLADKAQAEGAIDLALKFRADASQRADAMSTSLDVTEANLEQDRLQLGATYAEHARTAELNFDFGTAAQMWGKAYEQVAKWDAAAALTDKLSEAAAYLADGQHRGDAAALQTALATYGEAEGLTKPGSDEWAMAHLALGSAYDALGFLKQDPKLLHHAADTEADVGQFYNSSGAPSDEAVGVYLRSYGVVMMHLADVEQSADTLDQAAGALMQAVDHTDRKTAPLDWGATKSNLGTVLQTLGALNRDPATLKDAITAQSDALEELTRERGPLEWAKAQASLGVTLADLAQIERQGDPVGNLTTAIEAFTAALEEQTRARAPRDWASAQSGLGLALAARGVATKSPDDLQQALTALTAAREEQPSMTVPHDWALTTRNIALVQKRVADAGDDPAAYDDAIENFKEAAVVLKRDTAPIDYVQTLVFLGDAAVARADRSQDRADLKLAHDAYAAALPTYQQIGGAALAALKTKIQTVDKRLKG